MSEYPGAQPDSDDIRWCTGPSAEAKTEPASGNKDTGYATEEIIPYDEENWRLNAYYEIVDHLLKLAPREFDTLEEAVIAIASSDAFRVRSPAAGVYYRGQQIFHQQGTAGAIALNDVAGDGERIYYAQSNEVYAAKPADGTDHGDWSTNPYVLEADVAALAADGRYVYVLMVYDATYQELRTLNPATGTLLASKDLSTPSGHTMRANGQHCCLIQNQNIMIYDVGAVGVLTYSQTHDHGAPLHGLGLGRENAYIGGDQGTSNFDVRKIRLSTGAAVWSVNLPTSGAPTVNAIYTDGDLVYVATDDVSLTAGGTASVFALDRLTGATLWTSFAGFDIDQICADDHYVWASDDSLNTYLLDKWTGYRLEIIANTVAYGADGIGLFGSNGGTYLRRVHRGDPTRSFMRAVGTDDARRPFFNLAVPLRQ